MIKPRRLKRGSTIAVLAPSGGLAHAFPDNYELGLRNLQDALGFHVVEMPTARMSSEELYRHPELRAKDINDGFADGRIDGMIVTIGGYESVRILPYLDTAAILKHPKFIMGYSDSTTFLTYLNLLGMVTFYGPSVMSGIAQLQHLPEEYLQHLESILFRDDYPYTCKPFSRWTNGYKDWSVRETLGECLPFSDNERGWRFLQGSGIAEGFLWGGCIEVLEFLKGTAYWPEPEFWDRRILFFETSEEKPTPRQVGYMLRNYGMQGIFRQVKGVLFGRAKDYSEEEKRELNRVILDVIHGEFGAGSLPVAVDVDFGHTDPKLILPIGGRVRLLPDDHAIILLERPFAE
ncbi:LD-carboxypeptidase [Paenibacillus filicis]|uniref:LD-carboxypeptidase n=1 Tax=Paenibacillus gyeongsangnamensis TaxID=3388067 RepID=A0ABT4Q4U4_9BACL|nr:S66 peptidase family protein [Paenibacillus filicis]MCZ8511859.1 LD-carboxypeptidase [Paenibacillus filicis]